MKKICQCYSAWLFLCMHVLVFWSGCCAPEGCVGQIRFDIHSSSHEFLGDDYYFELVSERVVCQWRVWINPDRNDLIVTYSNYVFFPNKLIFSKGCRYNWVSVLGKKEKNTIHEISIIVSLPNFGEEENGTNTPTPLDVQLKKSNQTIAAAKFNPYYTSRDLCSPCPTFVGQLDVKM